MAWYTILVLVVQSIIWVLIFLFIGVWLFFYFYEYCFLHCFTNRHSSSTSSSSSVPAAVTIIAVQIESSKTGGLDQAVIESYPKLTYQKVDHDESRTKAFGRAASSTDQCVVCLGSFKNNETLRLIPRCGHVFHADCIDVWLSSHATCPYCRANLHLPPMPQSQSQIVSVDDSPV